MAITTFSNKGFKIIGTLAEMNLVRESREVTLNSGKKVQTESIHAPFGKGGLVIDVDGNQVEVATIWANKIDKEGKENARFKAYETMMAEYVTKTKATAENPATRLVVSGILGLNEYATEQGEYKSNMAITATKISRLTKEEDDSAVAVFSGLVKAFIPEMTKGDEPEPTGRMFLDMLGFEKDNNKEVIKPYRFTFEKDLYEEYEEWEDAAKKGDVLELSLDIVSKTIGATKSKAKGFGKRANVSEGYTITEYLVMGAEPANTLKGIELEELPWSMDDVKTLLDEREIMIEAAIKARKEKGSTPSKPATQSAPKKGLGQQAVVTEVSAEDMMDLPF
ncbi:MAG: hypothetical protein ACRCTZ_18375 [Sarcina sp.]